MKTFCIKILQPVFILIFLSGLGYTADRKYRVSEIPEHLLKDAKAVYREYETSFEVNSPKKAVMKVHFAITILNESAIDKSSFVQFYDKFSSIRRIDGTVYDENGEEIKKIKNSDISDYSAVSGFSIYEDNRVKYIDPDVRSLPFTVEYEYEIHYNGIINYPLWTPYPEYQVAVQRTVFNIIAPDDLGLRYMVKNIDLDPRMEKSEGMINYTWVLEDLQAVVPEPLALPRNEYLPVVYTGPRNFEIDGFEGNCETWKEFGNWFNRLNEGKNNLEPEAIEKIKLLLKDADNDLEKIRILYKYMQDRTRYVSIQIGIGGWQPFDAATVDRLSYGDCKALTNYMHSLLEVAGIKSYYTLVRAGEDAREMEEDFPSNQFNHAILCVPVNQDSIWLECTNQNLPFGYIGTFTDDRKVLLVNEDGGNVVRTREYTAEDNKTVKNISVTLDENGGGIAHVETLYTGVAYDDMRPVLLSDEKEKKIRINRRINLPNFELKGFEHSENKEMIPSVREKLDLNLRNYGTKLGTRMIIPLNLISRLDEKPNQSRERKSDILIRRSFIQTDTVTYHLPDGYKAGSIPENISVLSDFGNYTSSIYQGEKEITYIRSLSVNKGRYPAAEFQELEEFYDKVYKADNLKIVLTKN